MILGGAGAPRNFAQRMVNTAYHVTFLADNLFTFFEHGNPIEKRLQKIANISHTNVYTGMRMNLSIKKKENCQIPSKQAENE